MDLKERFRDAFENPALFNFVRHILDGGNLPAIQRILRQGKYKSVLDVGCGTGDFCTMTNEDYVGIDNSRSFVKYCKRKFEGPKKKFYYMDATKMKFKKNSFDAATIINTIHHLTDEQTIGVLKDMARVAKKSVIVIDAIPPKTNPIRKFLYSRDRGDHMRPMKDQIDLVKNAGLKIKKTTSFWSTSGLYKHSVIICEPKA